MEPLRPPTPNMQGRELVQWLQRVYDAIMALEASALNPPTAADHDDLTNNGGVGSHASIQNHIASDLAHGADSGVVGLQEVQELRNKTLNALFNTLIGLRHGVEVDNAQSGVHGVTGSVVGTTDLQVLTNKVIDAANNAMTGFRHGVEVDNAQSGVHGVDGDVVGTRNAQSIFYKHLVADIVEITADYTCIQRTDTLLMSVAGITATLEEAWINTGITQRFINASSGDVFVAAASGEFINGEAIQTIPVDSTMEIVSDGTGWRII